MAPTVDTVTKNKAIGLFSAHWRPDAVGKKLHLSKSTVYRWENRIQMYRSLDLPPLIRCREGRPRRIHAAARKSLLEYLKQKPWLYQDELAIFLEEEWGISGVSQPTISRVLKQEGYTNKRGQRVGHTQSEALRTAWQALMLDLTAEQLVFLDESIFKAQIGWRLMAYGPVGSPARYSDDLTRGDTWSILPAYTTSGYLCIGIRKGFFNGDAFVSWVLNELLPQLNPFPMPRSVVCLDNLNVHLDHRVREALEAKGCLVKFLPPYSPDYSPIELTFSILKAWIRRHFRDLRVLFQGDFGGFLRFAIENSRCDKYAIEHFRFAAGGYKFEGEWESFQKELDDWASQDEWADQDAIDIEDGHVQ